MVRHDGQEREGCNTGGIHGERELSAVASHSKVSAIQICGNRLRWNERRMRYALFGEESLPRPTSFFASTSGGTL